MGSASSGSPEQSIPTGHLGHPLKGCVPLVPLPGQKTSGQMSRMSRLTRFLPPSVRPAGRHRSSVNGSSRDLRRRLRMRRRSINDRPFQPPSNRNFALPTAFQPLFQTVRKPAARAPGRLFRRPLHVGQCRLLTHLEGKPAVVVGQRPRRHIAHPIIVNEL
jgi:hypothetical protein